MKETGKMIFSRLNWLIIFCLTKDSSAIFILTSGKNIFDFGFSKYQHEIELVKLCYCFCIKVL